MNPIFALISLALDVYSLIILGRVLLSWFPNVDPNNPIVRFLYNATEPVLRPVRQALPQSGMIDFSPLVVLVGIYVLRVFLRL